MALIGTRYWRTAAACPVLLLIGVSALQAKVAKMSTPTITCSTSTQTAINIQVCAGATGAPAGFTVQWVTAAALAAGPDGILGTADDGTWPPTDGVLACGSSFSGNANLSRYNLAPNACVTVDVGEFLFDEGASTNCPDALTCGTDYVFRAFAHASSTLNRSDFSANLACSTLPCVHDSVCTLTQGYWKTHVCAWPSPFAPAPILDPINGSPTGACSCDSDATHTMLLGSVAYTQCQLLVILNQPAAGNGLIALAHQLIAAKLNIAAGADGSAVAQAITDADALIGSLVVPPVGSGSLAPSVTSELTTALTNYNEGATGPGHCD
jgi:hypothetical protein